MTCELFGNRTIIIFCRRKEVEAEKVESHSHLGLTNNVDSDRRPVPFFTFKLLLESIIIEEASSHRLPLLRSIIDRLPHQAAYSVMSRATEATSVVIPASGGSDGLEVSMVKDTSASPFTGTIASPKTGGEKTTSSDQEPMNSWMWIISLLWSCVGGICTVVLPFVFQSLVGGLDFMRYVLLESNQRHSSPALNNLLHPFDSLQPKTNFPDIASTLTCLALFLCVALAVHPDGFTWQALRRMR